MYTETKKRVLEFYNKGLQLYKERKFEEALGLFRQAAEADPTDGPSKLYIGRCEVFIKESPPADWDGVFVMKTK